MACYAPCPSPSPNSPREFEIPKIKLNPNSITDSRRKIWYLIHLDLQPAPAFGITSSFNPRSKEMVPSTFYGLLEKRGYFYQQCIEGSTRLEKSKKYLVPLSTLTLDQLTFWKPDFLPEAVDAPVREKARDLGLWPEDVREPNGNYEKFRIAPVDPVTNPLLLERYGGMIAPGVVFVDEMYRTTYHRPSEVLKVFYERRYPLDTLKAIFGLRITNINTLNVLKEIYQLRNALSYPDFLPRTWEWGSKEYNALLGSELGNAAACFVLCAYGQSRARIARITTWALDPLPAIEFDLEPIVPGSERLVEYDGCVVCAPERWPRMPDPIAGLPGPMFSSIMRESEYYRPLTGPPAPPADPRILFNPIVSEPRLSPEPLTDPSLKLLYPRPPSIIEPRLLQTEEP
ncbi:hypothetical protein N7462_001999 [Penicillium macrosclerotiorum]|uniref:uncharacterized protein n=1 Tax=Penicillium macrosclerotiorum TaxID=303699 RepID=UPI002547A76A|nr:uncharacterized protein N7462_001999 [Penicillium macrosclerotiorum]KAJ5692576.1 hypothetical protein N7462_001999 [Penicillium macrosclerotiorum]